MVQHNTMHWVMKNACDIEVELLATNVQVISKLISFTALINYIITKQFNPCITVLKIAYLNSGNTFNWISDAL